ncbi:ketohexokinase-like [Drosophila hydei]|uniref:Ketohexokinase-like n=1 Tax=Drosophila hydei TaxID=7224 RepID=A0A6J1LE27_DROHY|nr:ketohexokinase-like [Drosophila hydei]
MEDSRAVLSMAMGKKTILCVGYLNIDCISIVKRFPKPNEVQTSTMGNWQRGGNAGNNCTVLRNFGADVEFFGVLSASPMISFIQNDMHMRGIKWDNCPKCNEPPPLSSVIVNRKTHVSQVLNCKKSFPYPTLEDFQKLDLSTYGWIHFRGCRADITIEMMKVVDAYNQTHSDKIVISMDFDTELTKNWPLVDYCQYVFFYRSLAKEMGWKSARASCENIDDMLNMRFGINLQRPFFMFLWNMQNFSFMDYDSNYYRTTSYKPKRFVDSLGATEAFVSGFIYAVYVRERTHRIAADFASLIANYKCTKHGFDHLPNILQVPVP